MKNIINVLFILVILLSSTLSFSQDNSAIERETLPLIQRFENNFILLGNINDSSNWDYYKKDLKSELFGDKNPYVHFDLQQNYNYRDTIDFDNYLDIITSSFYDGFIFNLNLDNIIIGDIKVITDTVALINIKVPRTLRGIWKSNMEVISINDTIVFKFSYQNKDNNISALQLNTFKFIKGRPNNVPFSYTTVLSLKDSLNSYLNIVATSKNKTEVDMASEKLKYIIHDTILTVHRIDEDIFEKYPISLFVHREATKEFQNTSVKSFNVEFITNFYQDVDNHYYGDRIFLKQVLPGVENNEKYSEKIIDVVEVDPMVAKNSNHVYYISNVILAED